MKLRLGYPDRIVEVDGETVRVFKGRLVSAPLDEVVKYYLSGNGLIPPAVREVVSDVIRALLSAGEFHEDTLTTVEYEHSISGS
ncbi:hypothetical protein [Thermococcus celer]|uniref:Uncharacterized protein n=1 Tax=Thermococcus celer Vu 13 = JCM 8558 TaxID=1293037 RepID=A0A218P208_THECE|nr:hypothetical protein [Thermococcus celer]ASI98975.1 hypothetical protein A3L02_05055 [Thermococcus celer Vu 13 = JCM 8558]